MPDPTAGLSETSGPCGPNPEKPPRAVEERELSQPTSYGVGSEAPLGQLGGSDRAEERAAASVRLSGFTPTTYDFIGWLVEQHFGHPAGSTARPTVIPIDSAATLFFILRGWSEDEFPGGKWATIQHLESLIEEALRDA